MIKSDMQLLFKMTKIGKFSKCCISISFSFMGIFIVKNKTLKEVHNYFIEILGFDEKSSDAALNNKYKK
jgi:hypothetical protein